MSLYGVSKVCHAANTDAVVRERLREDPAAALEGFPLSPEERRALLAGDVGWLFREGVHGYLLGHLARLGLFGLSGASYAERIRAAAGEAGGRPSV